MIVKTDRSFAAEVITPPQCSGLLGRSCSSPAPRHDQSKAGDGKQSDINGSLFTVLLKLSRYPVQCPLTQKRYHVSCVLQSDTLHEACRLHDTCVTCANAA